MSICCCLHYKFLKHCVKRRSCLLRNHNFYHDVFNCLLQNANIHQTCINILSCRVRRKTSVKFLGRTIKHKWNHGTVINILHGRDGIDAVYEILYVDLDELTIINHLIEDFNNKEVQFVDI